MILFEVVEMFPTFFVYLLVGFVTVIVGALCGALRYLVSAIEHYENLKRDSSFKSLIFHIGNLIGVTFLVFLGYQFTINWGEGFAVERGDQDYFQVNLYFLISFINIWLFGWPDVMLDILSSFRDYFKTIWDPFANIDFRGIYKSVKDWFKDKGEKWFKTRAGDLKIHTFHDDRLDYHTAVTEPQTHMGIGETEEEAIQDLRDQINESGLDFETTTKLLLNKHYEYKNGKEQTRSRGRV